MATANEIQAAKLEIAKALNRVKASPTVGASAMASFILDIFVDLMEAGDSKVVGEMRRMAERINALANESPATVQARALQLADDPGTTRQ